MAQRLVQYFAGAELSKLQDVLDARPYRRLSTVKQRDTDIDISDLAQMVHVSLGADKKDTFGGKMTQYTPLQLDSAVKHINVLAADGIRKIYLQYLPSEGILSVDRKIEEFAEILEKIKQECPLSSVIIDPIGICIQNDLRWGIRRPGTNEIDSLETLDLLAKAISKLSQSGADGFLTLGRINYEVQIASLVLEKEAHKPKIFSFSTNSETAFAYFNKVVNDPEKANTGQKIFVGNHDEMIARVLIDIHEGANVILQKPIENFAMFAILSNIQGHRPAFDSCLERPKIKQFLREYVSLKDAINVDHLWERLQNIEFGGYEVSGSYITQAMVEDSYSSALALTLQDERYVTAQSASNHKLHYIVGRNMQAYARFLHERQLHRTPGNEKHNGLNI